MSALPRLSCGEPWSRVSACAQRDKQTKIQAFKSHVELGVFLDRGATVHLVFGCWRILRRVDCVEKVGERRFIYELRIEPTKEGNVV